MYHDEHEKKSLNALAADMGLHDPANVDAALGLPLVMTGSDSTRTLDSLKKFGVRIHGPDDDGDYEWRSASGNFYWHHQKSQWLPKKNGSRLCCYAYDVVTANHPTLPPPDWTPHDGTKPGAHTASRTDAASLSDLQARQRACRVVEQAAHQALLESLTTQEQFTLVRAYNDSIHATRKADLDVHFALWAEGGAA